MVHPLSQAFTARIGAACVAILLAFGLVVLPASAEPRVALVIGNSAYQGDLPALPNPANDARLMANALKNVGFEVIQAEDASQDEMNKAIREFGKKLTAAGSTATGLFFYAGHGLQVAGENYLIPIDAQIQTEADVDLVAVSATKVLKQMDFAGTAVNIIVLDACRNNPLSNGARGMTRGLAEITSKPRGAFIAYSTAPGSTAADGEGANSPYTTALAETIQESGLSISDVFQEVRTKVLQKTNNEQTPWDSSSLTGRFYFKAPDETQQASLQQPSSATTTPAPDSGSAELNDLATEKSYWESVKDSSDPAEIELYLKKYPNGYFTDLANDKLSKMNGAQVASITPNDSSASTGGNPQTVQPEPAPQITFVALNQTVYAKNGGQVRTEPDGKASLLVKLPTNAEVQATGKSADSKWWRVTANGQTGYMHRTVVSEQPIQMASAAPEQTAPTQPQSSANAAAGGDGVEMIDTGSNQPAATNNGVDAQQVAQAAGAVQGPTAAGLNQALSGLLGAMSGNGQQLSAQSQDPQMNFGAYNRLILVRANAVILSSPGNGQPIGRTTKPTQLTASARTSNGQWYQVLLQNGTYGYLAGRFVQN